MKILVTSKPARFRRAGIEFTEEGVELDLDALTEEQQRAIAAEPMLHHTLFAEEGDLVGEKIEGANVRTISTINDLNEAGADQDRDGIPDAKDRDADGDGKFESRPKSAQADSSTPAKPATSASAKTVKGGKGK